MGQPSLGDLGERPSKTYRPSKWEKRYNEFFRYSFGPIVVLLLWWVTRDLDSAAFYAPNPEECEAFAPHAARMIDRFSKWLEIPEIVHEAITTSDDTFALAYAVTGYLDRIGVLDRLPNLGSLLWKDKNVVKTDRSSSKVPPPNYTGNSGIKRSDGTINPTINGIPISEIPGLGGQWQS